MSKIDNILIYHWQAWSGFLISHLVADYCHVEAKYHDDISHIENALTPNIKAILLQINLSHSALYPEKRQQRINALAARNIQVLNKNIGDIRKDNLHDMVHQAGLKSAKAKREGEPDQLLFIKSKLNWGGLTELRLPEQEQIKFIDCKATHIKSWDEYYTLTRGEVSDELWADNSIVIENYIENSDNTFYRVYGFGHALVVVEGHSNMLIKKIIEDPKDQNSQFSKYQILNEETSLPVKLQETIKKFISHHHIDYYCLDIVHNSKEFFIIDLNLTPYAGMSPQCEISTMFLIQGIQEQLSETSSKEDV